MGIDILNIEEWEKYTGAKGLFLDCIDKSLYSITRNC